MDCPKVSIIILNRNGLADSLECLESLKKITYPDYDVILVDNASEGDDAKVLQDEFGDYICVIQADRNYGVAGGRNIGLRKALRGDASYVLLLDNDIMSAPDFLSEMMRVASSDSRVAVAGARIYFYDQPDQVQSDGYFINYWTGDVHARGGKSRRSDEEAAIEVDWVGGGCMLISRDALLSIGLLDDRFSPYLSEDIDYCIRAARGGFRILLVPSARIWHKAATRLAFRDRKSSGYGFYAYYMVKNRFLLMEKHWNKLQLFTSSLCYVASWPKLFVAYLLYYRQWDMLKGFARGLLDYLLRK